MNQPDTRFFACRLAPPKSSSTQAFTVPHPKMAARQYIDAVFGSSWPRTPHLDVEVREVDPHDAPMSVGEPSFFRCQMKRGILECWPIEADGRPIPPENRTVTMGW